MGYLYKLITIPKEDEFHSLSFIFYSAKNNIRILRNVCFYIQNKDENKEQVEDVKKISNILFKYYFEFFYYEIESQFIDEPLKVEALIKNHIKEIVAVNDSLTQDIENFKPNDLLKTAITELQKIIKEVTEQLYIFTPDFEKQTFNTIPPPDSTAPFNTKNQKGMYDFFDEVIEGEISDIEIYNYIEKTTNNFDEVKTKLILKDLDFYLMASKMELENDYNLNDLVGKEKKYKSIKEVPFTYGKNLTTGELDKTIKHYDYEKLFYPHHFFNLYRLKKMMLLKLNPEINITQESLNNPYRETKKNVSKLDKQKNQQGINETPFTNERTYKLFNYIVDNWKYSADLKFGYILNFLNSNDSYLPHPKFNLNENYGFKMGVKYRSEYINFLGKEHDFYKDLQPEKAVAKRRYDELLTLYKTFREIYV